MPSPPQNPTLSFLTCPSKLFLPLSSFSFKSTSIFLSILSATLYFAVSIFSLRLIFSVVTKYLKLAIYKESGFIWLRALKDGGIQGWVAVPVEGFMLCHNMADDSTGKHIWTPYEEETKAYLCFITVRLKQPNLARTSLVPSSEWNPLKWHTISQHFSTRDQIIIWIWTIPMHI